MFNKIKHEENITVGNDVTNSTMTDRCTSSYGGIANESVSESMMEALNCHTVDCHTDKASNEAVDDAFDVLEAVEDTFDALGAHSDIAANETVAAAVCDALNNASTEDAVEGVMKCSIESSGKIEPWETATIANGVMFRLVMEVSGVCKEFLERLLNIRINKMQAPDFEKDFRENMKSKGIRLDVFIEDADGAAINIEMQAVSKDKDELGKRARYYQSVTDQSCLNKGMPYTKLKKSYIIFICTFDPYKLGLPLYTFQNRCNEDRSIELCDDAWKLFFNASGSKEKLTAAQTNLLMYINGGQPNDEFTSKLESIVENFRDDDGKRREYMFFSQELLASEARGDENRRLVDIVNMAKENLPADMIARISEYSVEKVREIARQAGYVLD